MTPRIGLLVCSFLLLIGLSAPATFAATQAFPVTVAGSTNWTVNTSLPPAGVSTTFTYGTKPLVPIMGDWDGNGTRTPGSYEGGHFKLSNTLPPGAPTIDITFGDPRGFPVVGDWNDDGIDDLAVVRNGAWTFRVETGPGGTGLGGSVSNPPGFTFGPGTWPNVIPVAGDWDNDGLDGIGYYTYATGAWQLRQTPQALGLDLAPFTYWAGAGSGSYPVVGDWNTDGTDTVGVKTSTPAGEWRLKNTNAGGLTGDLTFTFGGANDLPLVGGGNRSPTDIALSPSSVQENKAINTVVGTLTATDPDAGDTAAFTFATGAGDTDNAQFNLSGNSLRTSAVFDFETKSSYSIRLRVTDAGGLTYEEAFTITIVDVNDAPIADDETFNGNDSAHGNTTMVVDDPSDGAPAPTEPKTTVSGDILAGDTDVDGPGPLTVTPGTFATNDGGSVTIEADGDFTFRPAAATSCTDTSDFFDYTLEDSGAPELTDTGRVTINIVGCVWYVNNNDPAGNAGTASQPFDTLAQAEAASGANHTVFVFDGNNTASGYDAGGYAMNAGERLIGEHEGLVVDPDQGGALIADTLRAANSGAYPTITANNADVVDLDDGNEIRGFNIDAQGTGGGIFGGAGDTGGGTLDDINIVEGVGTAGQGPGLELNGTTGTFNVTNLAVDNNATGILLNNAGTTDFGSTSVTTTNGGPALSATGTNMSTSTFDNLTTVGSTSGGVSMVNTTGTTSLGDGAGSDLSLTTTSGATGAFVLSNAGNIVVPAGGTANVSATGGPAVNVTATTAPSLAFDNVSSTSSAGLGVNLVGLGSGTFSATGGTISGHTATGFFVSGGSGAVSYAGNIADGVGSTAGVTVRTGGTVTLSGTLSDSADAGGGVTVVNNSGGSTVFSGPAKTFSTGNALGVDSNGNTGHTVSFTNGGLDIDTTGATGFSALAGGTVNVTGAGNTIDTATGRALRIENTTIGDSDVTFQRIASNGAPSGIVLNSTANANGQLLVTGNGGACTSAGTCTGGAIQSSTGSGVSLTSVPGGVSLTRMAISGSADDGVTATTVAGTGLDLDNAWVNSNGNTPISGGIHGDHGVDLTGLTGTSTFTNSNVSNNADSNVVVEGATGAMNLDVTGGTYSGAGGGMGDSIYVEANSTGAQNLNVQGPITFANNVGSHVQHNGNPTSTADSDVTVNNATMSSPVGGGSVLGGGITVVEGGPTAGGGSNTDVTLTNNNIQNSVIGAIVVGTTGSVSDQQIANVDATITANTIGATGVTGSGSVQGNGIFVDSNGNSNVRALISNNNVRQWTNRNGIALDVLDGDAGMSATVKGNVLTEPNTSNIGTTTRGMTIQLGAAQVGDAVDVCLDIGDAANAALKNQVFGTGEGAQPAVRYLHEGPGSIVQLVGYAGPAAPAITDIQNWFQPRNNIGGTPTVTGTPTAPGGSTTTNAASCPQPAP